MILAAGIGSRLKPFTDNHPKALAPVGYSGMTALDYAIDSVSRAGARHIVINIHHFAQQIIDHIRDKSYPGLDIEFSDESSKLLDTGGGIAKAARLFTGKCPVIVHNADILSDINLSKQVKLLYETPSTGARLLVQPRESSRYLLFSKQMRLEGWCAPAKNSYKPMTLDAAKAENLKKMAFGGIHILNDFSIQALKNYAPPETPFSIIDFYVDTCQEINYKGFTPKGNFKWFDIGTPEKLKTASEAFHNS